MKSVLFQKEKEKERVKYCGNEIKFDCFQGSFG